VSARTWVYRMPKECKKGKPLLFVARYSLTVP
jgi:hypothetical protein